MIASAYAPRPLRSLDARVDDVENRLRDLERRVGENINATNAATVWMARQVSKQDAAEKAQAVRSARLRRAAKWTALLVAAVFLTVCVAFTVTSLAGYDPRALVAEAIHAASDNATNADNATNNTITCDASGVCSGAEAPTGPGAPEPPNAPEAPKAPEPPKPPQPPKTSPAPEPFHGGKYTNVKDNGKRVVV